jgi:Glycosyl hydrolase family 79 C-terminal beta domain
MCHDARVYRRVVRIGVLAALAVSLLGTGRASRAIAAAVSAPADDQPTLPASVANTPIGQTMRSGFVGVSVEYQAIHAYTGRDPRSVNPVLVGLLRGLAPGQAPVLRIGGDSTDRTWWPVRGLVRPAGVTYNLTKGWLRTTHALAAALGAKLILGVNLATARPALAAEEAQTLLQGIGRRYIAALEIGNEPDLYGIFAWYRDRRNHVAFSRGRNYSLNGFIKDFSHWRAALPTFPLVGPSFSTLTWMPGLPSFLSAERPVKTVTVHRYPLHGTTTAPSDPSYPSIPNLLSDYASSGLAQQVAHYVTVAHARGLQFRIDEMNSVSDSGRRGISDTFASALWVLDTLFDLASVGVDGVNLHSLPGAAYQLFSFSRSGSTWNGYVAPEYYGAMMFARAFPPGARLLPVTMPSGPVKVFSTLGADGHTRVVLINKDTTTPVTVNLQLPSSTAPARVETLSAPSLNATAGVTLAGQSFGASTTTGTFRGSPQSTSLSPLLGSYAVSLPAASAALLTQ